MTSQSGFKIGVQKFRVQPPNAFNDVNYDRIEMLPILGYNRKLDHSSFDKNIDNFQFNTSFHSIFHSNRHFQNSN